MCAEVKPKLHREIVNLGVNFGVKINIVNQYKGRQSAVFICLMRSSKKTQGKRKKIKTKKKKRKHKHFRWSRQNE